MAAETIPKRIDDVSREWLSGALGAEVAGFQTTFLEGGVLADAYKLHDIEYAGAAPDAPRSVVVKLSNAVDERRGVALDTNAYVKEVRFFSDLADKVPLKTPKVYHIVDDGSKGCEFFAIVMEDLTAHSKVFDQVNDPPDEDFVRKINGEVAAFHARFWESEFLDLDWLRPPDGVYRFTLDTPCRACPENVDTFVSLWKQMFGVTPFDDPSWPDLEPLTRLVTGPKSAALLDYMNDRLSARPRTLVHGDLRADNIFRTHPSRGLSAEESTLTYIDWQILQPGPPGPELTQAWQHTLPPEVRRKDLEFLRDYHDRLAALAPAAAESYPYEALVEDYRIAFVLWWMGLITTGVATIPVFDKPEGQRMRALWHQGLRYSWQAMQDHGCLAMVESFAAEVG